MQKMRIVIHSVVLIWHSRKYLGVWQGKCLGVRVAWVFEAKCLGVWCSSLCVVDKACGGTI